jgi:hypothetical protein
MQREPSTPARRFKHCRIMERPWRVPTMIAYPPPPPESAISRPILALPRVNTPVDPIEWRSPRRASQRRRRDCLFIPDMDVALQFIEARRRAAQIERDAVDAHRGRDARSPSLSVALGFDDPMVLGLLMLVAPPLAVTLVWSTTRLHRTAQIALTLFGAFTTGIAAAIAIAALR